MSTSDAMLHSIVGWTYLIVSIDGDAFIKELDEYSCRSAILGGLVQKRLSFKCY